MSMKAAAKAGKQLEADRAEATAEVPRAWPAAKTSPTRCSSLVGAEVGANTPKGWSALCPSTNPAGTAGRQASRDSRNCPMGPNTAWLKAGPPQAPKDRVAEAPEKTATPRK